MAEIAIVHPDLMSKGGGEAVCMNVIEALQNHHDISLITLSTPSFSELNSYYNTNVHDVKLEKAGIVAPSMYDIGEHLYTFFGVKLNLLQNALLVRYVNSRSSEFDLIISTFGAYNFRGPILDYIHDPTIYQGRREHITTSIYHRLIRQYFTIEPELLDNHTFVTNSEWTADRVQKVYNKRMDIIHPPVDKSDLADKPWEEREQGFVTVGRIDPSKNIIRNIRIIKALREMGYDVHLHIAGPVTHPDYLNKMQKYTKDSSFIKYEGELKREKLVDLICNHRYGIHGRENEHFGMSVAEFVAGGMIPFVPASGGQTEIVNNDELTYSDYDDGVKKIARVLSNRTLQENIKSELGNYCQKYGRDIFKNEIKKVVDYKLNNIV